MNEYIGLIGLGAIGIPIAHKLYKEYGDHFVLIASGERKKRLEDKMYVNNELFSPMVISDKNEIDGELSLLIVCIKNYDIESSINDIKQVVTKKTMILPLQNGIASFRFFRNNFPENIVLQGYVQGPNTEKSNNIMSYQNPGIMHIGDPANLNKEYVNKAYETLLKADVCIFVENEIQKMVWKKWMLNVTGNSITALTGADYSQFKNNPTLQRLCSKSMHEFLKIANLEGVLLTEDDIKDVIDYYISYNGSKKTSMLLDVINKRKTENDYLAGELLKIASTYEIELPITYVLYNLIKIKEEIYLDGAKNHA